MWYSITLAVGLVLLGLSLYLFKNAMTFLGKSERTEATVIAIERISDSDGDTFKPVFTYTTYQNQTLNFRPTSSSNPPGWKMGEKTTVLYDPMHPAKARLLTYFGLFGAAIIVLACAMPFIVLEAVTTLRSSSCDSV